MGLLIAGLLEALIAIMVGLFLLSSSNIPHVFAGVAFGVGALVLVLTLLLGRKSQGRSSDTTDRNPEPEALAVRIPVEQTPVTKTAPTPSSLPPEEAKDGATTALTATNRELPTAQSFLHDVVVRSRWRYRARDAQTRATTLAELVVHEGNQDGSFKDERPRQLRRLCDLAILSQGFEAWADGDQPSFRLDQYGKAHSGEELDDRIVELRREKEALEGESLRWAETLTDFDDPYRRSLAERMRFEKLRDLEERMEEVMLLEMGYETMRAKEEP